MAYAPLSPPSGYGHGHSHGHGRSTTPPVPSAAPPASKRDKRRNALHEKYQDLRDSFTNSRDFQFRQTVHELQNEMALISYADDAEDVAALVSDKPEDIAGKAKSQNLSQSQGSGSGDAVSSGRWYAGFVQEMNREREEREAGLVEVMNRHRNSLQRIADERDFRRQLAIEEHKKLAETIRERLVQAITSRKNRLMKDKEHLDLADTNALLLHPNQFSITNPASPGGIPSNRKTRGTRRGADFEDFGIEPMHKRKRKALEDDYGSPAPAREVCGLSTPAEKNKARLSTQQNAAAYNINSLFTEKELGMHSNNAHVAAVHFLAVQKRQRLAAAAASGTNTDRDDDMSDTSSVEDTTGGAAPDMERTASQHNYHTTRSTRTNGGGVSSGLGLLGDLAEKTATRPNLPYFILGNYHSRPNGTLSAPTPPALMGEEIDDDLARFAAVKSKPKGWVDSKLVGALVADIEMRDGEGPRQRFGNLHPDFPPQMDVHMVRAVRK